MYPTHITFTITARHDGNDWIIKVQKVFISCIEQSQSVLVVARTEEVKNDKLRTTLFMVTTDAANLAYNPIGMELVNPECKSQVFLDDIRLTYGALVGD